MSSEMVMVRIKGVYRGDYISGVCCVAKWVRLRVSCRSARLQMDSSLSVSFFAILTVWELRGTFEIHIFFV